MTRPRVVATYYWVSSQQSSCWWGSGTWRFGCYLISWQETTGRPPSPRLREFIALQAKAFLGILVAGFTAVAGGAATGGAAPRNVVPPGNNQPVTPGTGASEG